jgi:enoyl-CoA hydratase/carnithine racemase
VRHLDCRRQRPLFLPEVKVGFTGGIISNLASRIPHKIAMELLLLGEPIDARRAYEVGYVNKGRGPG